MILVAGATGVLGSEIVRQLRAEGRPVRALVRETSSPARIAELEQSGVELVRGDLKDRSSLDAALAGIRSVISTVTTILTSQPGDSFDATDGAGTRNLIDSAANAGVDRFIYISFDTARVPDSPLTSAKRDVETHLRQSGLTYTILQPGLFMESWLGPYLFADPAAGTAKVYGPGTHGVRYVAVRDVAAMTVRCLAVPAARNATVPFGGPEPLSQREAVKLFEKTTGKPFEVTEIPADALEAQRSATTDPFEKTFAALMLGVARGLGADLDVPPPEFEMSQMIRPSEFVQAAADVAHASTAG